MKPEPGALEIVQNEDQQALMAAAPLANQAVFRYLLQRLREQFARYPIQVKLWPIFDTSLDYLTAVLQLRHNSSGDHQRSVICWVRLDQDRACLTRRVTVTYPDGSGYGGPESQEFQLAHPQMLQQLYQALATMLLEYFRREQPGYAIMG